MLSKNIQTEIFAGLTSFLATAYIVVVNPQILSTPGTGVSFNAALTATVLISFFATFLMGAFARLPYVLAPAMGVNAFFVYTMVLEHKIPWSVALGLVFLEGLLFFFVSVTPLRMILSKEIPECLKLAVTVGIGLFLCFIGLKNSGIVVDHPATLIGLGKMGTETSLSFLGFLLIVIFSSKKNPLSFIISVSTVSILSLILGITHLPETFFAPPDFSLAFQMNLKDTFHFSYLPLLIALFFTDLFDTTSTFIGISKAANLVDSEGNPLRMRQGFIVDSFATIGSCFIGISPATTYLESAAGISVGGRTGLTAIVCALCFLPCLFISPLVNMIPSCAVGPVLIYIGFQMFGLVNEIKFNKLEDGIPAFITIVLIPLTFSISHGIIFGILAYVLIHLFIGNRKKMSLSLYIIALLSLLGFLAETLSFT